MTQVLARTTTLLDGRKTVHMTGKVYLRAILPIGVLYSLSLVCSNLTYLYLSVAFIQMLKVCVGCSSQSYASKLVTNLEHQLLTPLGCCTRCCSCYRVCVWSGRAESRHLCQCLCYCCGSRIGIIRRDRILSCGFLIPAWTLVL